MALLSLPSLVSLVLLVAHGASAFTPSSGSSRSNPARFVPNSYFIEVDASSAALSKRGLTPFAALNRTLAAVSNHGIHYDIRERFTDLPEVFHGASIRVDEGTKMEDLAQIEGVKKVYPVQLFSRPLSPAVADAVSFSAATINDFSTLLASDPEVPYRSETYYPHVQTGVAALHNAGYLGEGVKIAILDNGVDYKNPILGGCFGEGCHLSFGYAFADDDYTGANTPVQGPDPYSSCADHGTHLTGIVGALANPLGFSGVAPLATLGHYRIYGCSGDAGEDLIVAAMMRALQEGVQVISLSIAGGVGWLDLTPSQIMTEYLSSQGVHVIAGGGNERTEGLFFADAPAATVQGTVVGAVDTTFQPAYNATLSRGDPLPYIAPVPLSNLTSTYKVVFLQTNTTKTGDACSALGSSVDVAGKLVVVGRGGCTFAVKQQYIAQAGGAVVLIYNSRGSLALPQLDVGTTGLQGVAGLRYEEGVRLRDLYVADPTNLKISFPFGPLVPGIADNVSGGLVSYYSNFGPTNELYMYPTLLAPGTNILSTVPGGVALMRGSSMSTPYHAGAVALLLSARAADNLTPAQVKSLFMTTNTFAPTAVGASTLSPVILQGAGVINVNKAIAARTLITPSQFLLNDTTYLNNQQTMTLNNRNSFPVRYQLSWRNAQGIKTYNNGASKDGIPSTTPGASTAAVPRVAFSSRIVTVPARSSLDVRVTFTPPNLGPSARDQFPIYSGFVVISGAGQGSGLNRQESYTVPFFGMAARMYDMPLFDRTNTALGPYLPFVARGEAIQTGPTVYSRSNPPVAYYRLGAGSRVLNMDLVNADIDFVATVPEVTNPSARLVKRSTSELVERATPTLYADVPVLGRIYSPDFAPARDYLLNFSPYGYTDYEIPFSGTYTDTSGKQVSVPDGQSYRFLVRVLKITGNPLLSADYESWLSPSFSFSSSAAS
ncbi:hypothetical protein JCM6882_009318 [Rhodosporidiobolus microsporus]